jgi:MFS family permease
MPQDYRPKNSLTQVISAATVGALIEFYDFYIFGSLATIISTRFFPPGNPTANFLATLATFAAGLLIRPFGALFFGRLGDLIGRKYTFMVTILLMGGATFAIGLMPAYEVIGYWAPVAVLILRLLQGLAIGGEFGGAVTFVAEHAPENRRGFWTSWISVAGGFGLVVSFLVIVVTKSSMSLSAWENWGWRIPFLVSGLLVLVSVAIRRNMSESPLFIKAREEGRTSHNPLRESFANKQNLKVVLLAIFGLTLGVGVVGYASTFFLQTFLIKFLFLDYDQANLLMIIGVTIGTPLYVFFGWLSDKVGRKPILLLSLFLGIIGFRPVFALIYQTVSLQNKTENKAAMTVKRTQSYSGGDHVITTTTMHSYFDGTVYEEVRKDVQGIADAENSKSIRITGSDELKLVLLVIPLMIIVTMSAGPIGVYLVEMFPLKIRYTSLSLPYHVGYGIFGGMSPVISSYLISKASIAHQTNYYLAGLNYAILLMSVSLVIGTLYLKESKPGYRANFKSLNVKNRLNRWLGILWLILGLFCGYFGVATLGIPKIRSGKPDDLIFGIIVTFIVTPTITIGLWIFGKYALLGEYDDRPRGLPSPLPGPVGIKSPTSLE